MPNSAQVKRERAAERQKKYDGLSLEEKLAKARQVNPHSKEVKKLEAQLNTNRE